MTHAAVNAHKLDRYESIRTLAGIGFNPLSTLNKLHAQCGPFVVVSYPTTRRSKQMELICISCPDLYRTISSDSETWRTVNTTFRGFGKRSAATRMGLTMTRLRGQQHAHYRQLMAPPLAKSAVFAHAGEMYSIASRHVETWKVDEPVDFAKLGMRLMQELSVSLLFGEDFDFSGPAADLIQDGVDACWPVPSKAHARWFFTAPKLEQLMYKWGDKKRGNFNDRDLFSILMNNNDHLGGPVDQSLVSSLMVFTYGAAYETCQNALAWTVALLAQHQDIASALVDELNSLNEETITSDTLDALPVLDGVVKEGMRLFAPVPIQYRRSTRETELSGERVPTSTRVLVSAFLINRNPEIYPEPEKFIPERWRSLKTSPYKYTVFGAGPRMCPGFVFGMQMVKAALAAIFKRYMVDLPSDTRIDHRLTITLAPVPSVPVIFRSDFLNSGTHKLAGTINNLVKLPTTDFQG